MTIVRRTAIGVLATMVLCFQSVKAAEIRLMSANAVKEAVSELVAEFEKATGHTVKQPAAGVQVGEFLARRRCARQFSDLAASCPGDTSD